MPEVLARIGIERHEVALVVAGEHHARRRRHDPRHAGRRIGELPAQLARRDVERAQRAPGLILIDPDRAAHRAASRRDLRLLGDVGRTGLARGDEEQPPRRIERRRHEVGAAPVVGQAARAAVVEDDWPAVGADLARPGRRHERLPQQQLAGLAVEHVEEAVAVGDHDHFPRAALPVDVRLHRHVVRVPVVGVVRRELIVPAQPAGVGVERDEGIRVEVVSQPVVAVVVGVRVAGAPVEQA